VSDENRNLLIPRLLDEPPKFLFWDYDVFLVAALGMFTGLAIGFFFIGTGLGLVGAYLWTKTKAGRHPGYGLHCIYWHTPLSFFRRTPPSARRHFVG
jgi:conjugal transfer pilus assembly protein TraL